MRRVLGQLLLGLTLLGVAASAAAPAAAGPAAPAAGPAAPVPTQDEEIPVELTWFWHEGCPYCAAESRWLAEMSQGYDLEITGIDIYTAEGRERFESMGAELGFDGYPVPVTIVEGRIWVGFNDATREDMEATIKLVAQGLPVPPGIYGNPGVGTCDPDDLVCEADSGGTIDFFGREISLGDQSLFVSTLIIGFVDGINPCSLWVISVLLTIVVRTASRRRVVAVGATFLAVTAAMYGLYMVGIYSALSVVGFLGVVQVVVALAAAVFGVVSIKDYFAFKKGLSFTISDSAKPGIYQRMRRAAGHHQLIPALAATIGLAVAVSLLETPCTAGFPVLWTGLLQANGVSLAESVWLWVVYMVPFLVDELLVFGVAVVTMRAAKLQEKHGELLKLFAGVTMVVLAAVMALDPALMQDPVIAVALFALAFVAAAITHLITTRLRASRLPERAAAETQG